MFFTALLKGASYSAVTKTLVYNTIMLLTAALKLIDLITTAY
jgi:hypothetical protein